MADLPDRCTTATVATLGVMGNADRSALVERSDGFNYDYAMNCACGEVSVLSAQDYFAEADSAHMSCSHCGAMIHFGIAVAALRDRDDPALDNDAVASFTWYHTSTDPDWPSPDYARRFVEELEQHQHHLIMSRELYISDHTTKALHLGTYETAIENMLRRMDDEDDGGSQFYLYRVALRLDPARINAGYRDENHEEAAQLTISDLDSEELDAVRYLNVHEGTGVLSLAVRPEIIDAVQRVRIPLPELTTPGTPDLVRGDIDALEKAKGEMEAAQAKVESIPATRRRMMYFGVYPDPDGLAKQAGDLEHHYIDLRRQLENRLAEIHLPRVSPVIRRDFNEAMASWKSDNPTSGSDDFIEQYRVMAALLERQPDVINSVANQDWRVLLRP
ncbi:hypothetical protein GCM10009563_08940 [Subtercola frigoramans]